MPDHPHGASPLKLPYRRKYHRASRYRKPMPRCEDSAAESPKAAYHLGLWRYRSPHTRKRGNPNWGRPIPPAPTLATEFELRARQLHLTPEMYASSRELRAWCEQNRNRVYIPEWLLAEWSITVDALFSGTA
jgi:hypothetical protein